MHKIYQVLYIILHSYIFNVRPKYSLIIHIIMPRHCALLFFFVEHVLLMVLFCVEVLLIDIHASPYFYYLPIWRRSCAAI